MRQREPVDETRDRVYGPLIKASVQSFTSSVRQIFAPINASGLDIEPFGSCCLVWHRGHRYVITAAHVAAASPRSTKYLMGSDELVELPGFRLHGSGTSGTEHRLDIAVARLTATTADHLKTKGCVFLTPDQIGEQFDVAWPMYAALGYPHSTTRRVGQNAFRAQPVLFTSGGLENEDYRELRLDVRVYIAMQYDHKKIRTDSGVHSSKNLDGMSGGALFRLPRMEKLGNGKPRLAGIIIEQDMQRQALVGVRVDAILVAIDNTIELRG